MLITPHKHIVTKPKCYALLSTSMNLLSRDVMAGNNESLLMTSIMDTWTTHSYCELTEDKLMNWFVVLHPFSWQAELYGQ